MMLRPQDMGATKSGSHRTYCLGRQRIGSNETRNQRVQEPNPGWPRARLKAVWCLQACDEDAVERS